MIATMLPVMSSTAADNLLKNPAFSQCRTEQGKQVPEIWRSGSWGSDSTKSAEFFSDGKKFHFAAYAASIRQAKGENYCQFGQKVYLKPLTKPRKLNISAWVAADKAEAGSIVVVADTAQKKAVLWKTLASFKNSFDWKEFSGQLDIPAGVTGISLFVRLKGTGQIWIDDCAMSFGDEAAAAPKDSVVSDSPENLLVNPELTGEINKLTEMPAGWEKIQAPGYETVFNVKIISGTPNSLMINWESGGAKCGAGPKTLKQLPAGQYIFKGQCRTSDGSQAVLGMNNLVSAAVSGSTWQPVSIYFKAGVSEECKLYCWNIGQGNVEFRQLGVYATAQQDEAKFPLEVMVMPVENTVIWSGTPQVNSFENAPVPVAFDFKKVSGFKTGSLVVEIPEALKITEAYNFHPSCMEKEIPVVDKVSKQGKTYLRYTFTNPRIFHLLQDKYAWARKLVMAIEPAKPLASKSFTVFWHLEADGAASPEQSFSFNLLPSLKKRTMPRNFPIFCWAMKDFCFADAGVTKKMTDNFELAGINVRPRCLIECEQYSNVDKQVVNEGWKLFVPNPDYAEIKFNRLGQNSLLAKAKMVQYNTGKMNPHHLCPTWFNTNPEFKEYLIGFLRDKYKTHNVNNGDIILFDIEPWQPMTWCFCEDCRRDFARRNNLAAVPSATEILDKHADAWSKFRCLQTAEMTKLNAEIFKQLYPDSKILDYDYAINFSKPDFRSTYYRVAKDPQLNEAYFDGHISSYYHYLDEQAFDLIETNVKNLKKDYYVICAIDKLGYLSKKKVLAPKRLRLLLLATAVNGGKGFAIYPGEHIDGSYLQMFNSTMHEIAEVEDILQNGRFIEKNIAVSLLPSNKEDAAKYFRFRAQQLKDKTLVSLFNYGQENGIKVNIDLKRNDSTKYTVINVDNDSRLLPGKGQYWTAGNLSKLTLKLKPMSAVLLLVRQYQDSDSELPSAQTEK